MGNVRSWCNRKGVTEPRPAMPPDAILYAEDLPGGATWSGVVRRGCTLRLTDVQGAGNVSLLAYRVEQPLERLNLPDTLKAQHTAKLTAGHVLMSDMGRVLLSITGDTVGWHDPLGGYSNAEAVRRKYGEATYQTHGNKAHRNAHDGLLIELGKHGLGARDLVANMNFFSRLDVDAEGRLAWHPDNSAPGAHVDLRAEMDVLIVLSTAQHPLDPAPSYDPRGFSLALSRSAPPAADDRCRMHCTENARAFILTERLYL